MLKKPTFLLQVPGSERLLPLISAVFNARAGDAPADPFYPGADPAGPEIPSGSFFRGVSLGIRCEKLMNLPPNGSRPRRRPHSPAMFRRSLDPAAGTMKCPGYPGRMAKGDKTPEVAIIGGGRNWL